MNPPTTVEQLRDLLQTTHGRLEQVLAQVPAERMTVPGVGGPWSIKDVLAHVLYWEQHSLRELEPALRGAPPDPQPLETNLPPDLAWVDAINANVFAHYRDWPMGEVRAEFDRSFEQILALVARLSDADLAPGSPLAGVLGESVVENLAGNTYDHYPEHTDAIRAWLEPAP